MKFKLSIIIPVFNSENTIEKAIRSITNQDLKEVEIIVVNDGSTDSTLEVLERLRLENKSIKIVDQPNQGPSAARNRGLQIASGEYITFLDADDSYPDQIFKKIYTYAISENADLFVGNIRCFNDVRTWNLPYMKKLFDGRKKYTTTLEQSPEIQHSPSVCNKWFKNELLNGITFNTDLSVAEDLLFTEQCYLKASKIALADWCVYNYRVVKKESLSKKSSMEFFWHLLQAQQELLAVFKAQNKEKMLPVIIGRQTQFFIDSIFLRLEGIGASMNELIEIGTKFFRFSGAYFNPANLFEKTERKLLLHLFLEEDTENIKKLLSLLADDVISKHAIYDKGQKYNYLYGQFPMYATLLAEDPEAAVKVEDISLNEWILTIKGFAFIRGFDSGLQKKTLRFIHEQTGEMKEITLVNSLRTDLSYIFKGDKVSYDFGGFEDAEIDLEEILDRDGKWEASLRIETVNGPTVETDLTVPLAEIKNKVKVKYFKTENGIKEVFCLFEEGKHLSILFSTLSKKAYIKSKIRLMRRNLRYDIGLVKRKKYKSFVALLSYKILHPVLRNKKIWLMGERPDTAQDNTFHLFKHVRTEAPAINAFYVIQKNAVDRKAVQEYGNIIDFGSLKHTLYLLCADVTINSYVERPNMFTPEYIDIIKYYPEYRKNKKVFLQHGVIGVSRVNHVLHKNKVDYDLFVTSSQFEKDHIVKEFGYPQEEVIVTGLARWDKLDRTMAKRKILLMPTWRSWIQSSEELSGSPYFNRYINLLRNERLHALLEENDYELIFYPHYQIQRILTEQEFTFHERIKVVRQGERRVQDLLNECHVLVTDYSSVSNDFAYMEKPVIFYQFDYDEFYSKHYNEGPINHKEELFGPVVDNEESIISSIQSFITDSQAVKEYRNKMNRFVEIKHGHHCASLVDEIKKV